MKKVKAKATSTEKLPVTTKKQKFVGFKEFIDAETGEIIPMQLNQVEDRDFNFTKVWLRTFIEGLDGIANKRMKLAFWIIDNLNKENQFIGTFKKMADETGLSEYTVIMTMRELQKGNPPFLKKLQSGVYQVNPDILYKGSHKSRMGVIYEFGSIPSRDSLEKQKAFDEQNEAIKAKQAKAESTDTTVTDTVTPEPITGVVTRTIEAETTNSTENTTTETTVADTDITVDTATMETSVNADNTATASTTTTEETTATESVNHRTGRAGRNKPSDWLQIKAKIISGEISKTQYCRENHLSINTLRKWLAEND